MDQTPSTEPMDNNEEKKPEGAPVPEPVTAPPAAPPEEEKKPLSNISLRVLALLVAGITLLAAVLVVALKEKPADGPLGQGGNNSGGALEAQLAGQSKIKKFENYEELKEFLDEHSQAQPGGYDMFSLGRGAGKDIASPMAPVALEERSAATNAPAGMGGDSQDFSQTNVQVEGVDEADIIKTDGQYVYAVAEKNLFIVKATPADQAEVLAKIEFKNQPQDIFISGDRLVVFGNDYELLNSETYRSFIRKSQYTFFKVFDISDRKNPRQVKDLDFEGDYFNSRMIGDYVYFITSTYTTYYDDELPVPRVLDGGQEIYDRKNVARCDRCPDVYYFDIPYENFNLTSIAAINVKDPSKDFKSEVYLLSSNQNLYMSEENLYITYTKHISEYQLATEVAKEIVLPRLSDKDRERIKQIEETENFILSPNEKAAKIAGIVEKYKRSLTEDEAKKLEEEIKEKLKQKYADISKELEKTVIHKIAVDKDEIEYQNSGEVTGQVLNQFSMDEHDGFFRIATTKNRTWLMMDFNPEQTTQGENNSYNNMYVLDKDMKVVGSLENLAKGERIYSVRFMDNRAYMVTFKQTDPLFVIDLANAKEPKVLGELKIPGFSNYLHPYDENTLIGVGKDAAENEFGGVITKGVKVALFDVSNVSSPKQIDEHKFEEGTDSIALHDHKAFLFSKEKNLLVIPVTMNNISPIPLMDRPEFSGRPMQKILPAVNLSGAAVFKVDKNGIELRKVIEHSNSGLANERLDWCGFGCYDSTVRRSLYIGDMLYTYSTRYLQANKLDDLSEVKRLELRKGKGDDFNVVN